MKKLIFLLILFMIPCASASIKMAATIVDMPSSTGNQDITIPGFGTPVAAIFMYGQAYLNSGDNIDLDIGYGFTDGTNQFGMSVWSNDGISASSLDTQAGMSSSHVVYNRDNNYDAYAQFSTWITDGVRIYYDEPTNNANDLVVILIGGDGVNAEVDVFQLPGSGEATISTAFEANMLFCLSTGNENLQDWATGTSVTGLFSAGIAANDGTTVTQGGMSFANWDGYSSNLYFTNSDTGFPRTGAGALYEIQANDFTSSQYQFSISGSTSSAENDYWGCLAIDVPSNNNVWMDTITVTSGTGVKSFTTGFEPNALFGILGYTSTSSGTMTSGDEPNNIAMYFSDGSTDYCHGGWDEDAVSTSNSASYLEDNLLVKDGAGNTEIVDTSSPTFSESGWSWNLDIGTSQSVYWHVLAVGEGGWPHEWDTVSGFSSFNGVSIANIGLINGIS